MDTVIDLCQVASDIPAKLFTFFIFEALEFLYEIEFEFHRDPGREFICDILVSIVPPYRPGFEMRPMAEVFSIHCLGVRVKLLSPASFLNPSNSTGLKAGLLRCSPIPRNSMVLRFRIQFLMRSSVWSGSLYRAMSVMQM
jgi:hypothetical protein